MKNRTLVATAALLSCAGLMLALAYHVELWPLELVVSFAMQATFLLLALVAALLIYVVVRGATKYRATLVFLLATLLLVVYSLVCSIYVQPPVVERANTDAPHITFVTFNREYTNNNIGAAAQYIRHQNSEVVALQETNPAFTRALGDVLGFEYMYNSAFLNTVQGTGAAIISKYPLSETKTFTLSRYSSLVRAVADVPDAGKTAFYSLHLVGPFSPEHYELRKKDSQSIADIVLHEKLPMILGGDFNTTIFSPSLRAFNTATHSVVAPTTGHHPACSRFNGIGITCLRIDHVYIPRTSTVLQTAISPHLGSDHRALVVQIEMK